MAIVELGLEAVICPFAAGMPSRITPGHLRDGVGASLST
jgi:hypothetical protein